MKLLQEIIKIDQIFDTFDKDLGEWQFATNNDDLLHILNRNGFTVYHGGTFIAKSSLRDDTVLSLFLSNNTWIPTNGVRSSEYRIVSSFVLDYSERQGCATQVRILNWKYRITKVCYDAWDSSAWSRKSYLRQFSIHISF